MAGIYSDPASHRSQPWHQPALNPAVGRAAFRHFPPGRGWVQAAGRPAPGDLAGLPEADSGMGSATYAAASIMGGTIGGAIVGYIASGSPRGAATGGLFTAGLAALSDAVLFGQEGKTGYATTFILVGVGSLGGALYRFSQDLGGRR